MVLQILSDGRTKDGVIAQDNERMLKCLGKEGNIGSAKKTERM